MQVWGHRGAGGASHLRNTWTWTFRKPMENARHCKLVPPLSEIPNNGISKKSFKFLPYLSCSVSAELRCGLHFLLSCSFCPSFHSLKMVTKDDHGRKSMWTTSTRFWIFEGGWNNILKCDFSSEFLWGINFSMWWSFKKTICNHICSGREVS